MASALKIWRRQRAQAAYWVKATERSKTMLEGEVVANIDLALMSAGQAITRYRQAMDKQMQEDQLRELRIHLEASLGMLDNILYD